MLSTSASVTEAGERAGLSVVIPVFDASIPNDPVVYQSLGVFPRIREVEALLWPFGLREKIVEVADL